jgi:hypothetical protein
MLLFINQLRTYHKGFTQSELYLPDGAGRFCYVLEDEASATGIKVPGRTCIPEAVYDVSIAYCPRFKKDMIQLHNTTDKAVERKGMRFTGIFVHGGNTVIDTEGCPLVAYNTDNKGRVWTRASDDLFLWVKRQQQRGNTVKWVISSL